MSSVGFAIFSISGYDFYIGLLFENSGKEVRWLMRFRNIKPIHILWQETLETGMLDGVVSGIAHILLLAGVSKEIKLKYLGKRRQPNWRNPDNTFAAYQSLDWHIELARLHSKEAGHLNSTVLLNSLKENPAHQTRYELVVVNEPLHWSDDSLRGVAGVAQLGQGAVITISRHLPLSQPLSEEFLLATQMLAMHELGHVFGLFPENIGINSTNEELEQSHCLNECAMRWRIETERCKKIKDMPFCPSCLEKLREYFTAVP